MIDLFGLDLQLVISSTSFHCRYDFFKEAGEVVAVRLASSEDGRSRGFGHVDFASAEDAKKVMNSMVVRLMDSSSFD